MPTLKAAMLRPEATSTALGVWRSACFHHQHRRPGTLPKAKAPPTSTVSTASTGCGAVKVSTSSTTASPANSSLRAGSGTHPVGELAAPDIADGDRYPVHQQNEAHRAGAKSRSPVAGWGREGKRREGTAVTERRLGVDQQQRFLGEHRELLANAGGGPFGRFPGTSSRLPTMATRPSRLTTRKVRASQRPDQSRCQAGRRSPGRP